jgi:hypothetical protein
VKEGATAAFLTAIMIMLFLGSWRSTLIVCTSIPLSILTSCIILWAMGHTLNNTQTLTILGVRADNSTFVLSNTVVATRQLDDPRFGLYRLSIQFNDLPGGSVLPVSVRVLNPDPAALGASVTEAIEVR